MALTSLPCGTSGSGLRADFWPSPPSPQDETFFALRTRQKNPAEGSLVYRRDVCVCSPPNRRNLVLETDDILQVSLSLSKAEGSGHYHNTVETKLIKIGGRSTASTNSDTHTDTQP